MSDAKAKAEARRAKILARDTSKQRTVSAVMDIPEEEEVDLNLPIGPTTPKERPLAARRRLVRQEKSESEQNATPEDGETSTKEDSKVVEVSTELSADQKATDLKLPPKKTLEEIEREVAENTAKFDERTLGKKTLSDAKQGKDSENVELIVKKVTQKSGVDGASLMRLVRVLLIFLMAFYSGYRTVDMNRQEALRVAQLEVLSPSTTVQELDEFGGQYISSSSLPLAEPTTEERTWGQYFQQKVTSQIETPVSAVALAWYLSRALAPALTSQLAEKKKATKPLEMVMEFLTTGIAGYVEGVYTVLGEICLHLCLMMVSVVFFTLYFTPAEVQAASSPATEL